MNTIRCRLITVFLAMTSLVATADELTGYVQNCANELGFSSWEVPTLDCNDGVLFKGGIAGSLSNENDYVGHARINANVDLVFACRWLQKIKPVYSEKTVSVELIIHNRSNGGTCFFAAKDPNPPIPFKDPRVSTTILSPTDPSASSYWMQPTELDAKKFDDADGTAEPGSLRCVGCHVAGPYIASAHIAPALAKFGLLNDGHDTFASRYYAVNSPVIPPATQSAFLWWTLATRINNVTVPCASGCHSIGSNSTAARLLSAEANQAIVPSLQDDIALVRNFGVMPADNPPNKDRDNSYRWVNMSSPLNDPNGEFEMLNDLKSNYLRYHCENPVSLTAHVIDSDEPIRSNELPDKLHQFNLQDGLVCLNKDQPNGRQCRDYQTRYMCGSRFTAFQSRDTPTGSGDWEPRNSFKGLCASPTWMQTRYKEGDRWIYVNGPADRLAQFDNKGLVCFNAAQNNGQCSNYVVRFECP